MKEFILAALPWVLCGIAVAIICANLAGSKQKTQKKLDRRIALGLALGLMFGSALNAAGLWGSHGLGLALGPCGVWPWRCCCPTKTAAQTDRPEGRFSRMGSFFVILQQPRQTLYGLHRYTNDRDQSRDIPMLSRQFYDRTGGKPQPAPAFYVVSRDYEPSAGAFVLFVGDGGSGRTLEPEVLPEGTYAVMTVRPKLGFLWGAAIGQAKRWFYTKWLPGSGYEARNLEYELHTEQSTGKHPSVELRFAIQPAEPGKERTV